MTENQKKAERTLERIRDFDKTIQKKKDKVDALRLGCLPSAIRYDKDIVQSTPQNFTEIALVEAADIEREIVDMIETMESFKLNAYEYLKTIDELDEQNVLLYYYFDGLYWDDVANKVHVSRAKVFEIRDAALESFGCKL